MPPGHNLTEKTYPSADYDHKVASRSYSDADLAARAEQIATARALRLQQRAPKKCSSGVAQSSENNSSTTQHSAGSSGQHPASSETILHLIHLLPTQIYLFYECFDHDEDVLCLASTSKDTNQNVILLRGAVGKYYFGAEGVFGLCRYQSLQMVATTCRLWNKIEFVNQCEADTLMCVELCITNMQRSCFFAGAPRQCFFATFDGIDMSGDERYCLIDSLRLKVCIIHDRAGIMIFFDNMYSLYDDAFEPLSTKLLNKYRGVAFPQACRCQPLLIPSKSEIETHHLEAIQHRPTFLIAIWKSDGATITPLPSYGDILL